MPEKEYIERGSLLEWVREFYPEEKTFASAVINAPAADVQEAKHGKWEYIGTDTDKHENVFRCSNCALRIGLESETPFCPNCGAKMDKE